MKYEQTVYLAVLKKNPIIIRVIGSNNKICQILRPERFTIYDYLIYDLLYEIEIYRNQHQYY